MTLHIRPSQTALLVVDVQVGSVELDPLGRDQVLSDLQRLVAQCHRAGVQVVFIRHEEEAGSRFEPHTPGWELAPPLAPEPGDRVIPKNFNSAFRETSLQRELDEAEIDTLLITGIQTEYCVDTTVRVAFEHGYRVIIPGETHTTFDNGEISAATLRELYAERIWDGRFATVAPLEEVLAALAAE